MQAFWDGRLVCIEQPELLEHVFMLTRDKHTQAALLRTSKAWAALGTRCSPLEVAIGLSDGACRPLGKRGIAIEPHPALHGLPAAAAWLARQRRLVASLLLQLDPDCSEWAPLGGWNPAADESVRESLRRLPIQTVRAQAAEVLHAVPDLGSMFVRSVCDVQWMPQLTALTNLDLMFVWDPEEYAGGAGPLDCIARIAPRLRTLSVDPFYDDGSVFEPPFLSAGASLPPSLTSLDVSGLVKGLEPHFSQLESLRWHPIDEEPYVSFQEEAIHGLSQASRLTSLAISGQVPTDIPAFFGSLACLTRLRSLSLSSPLIMDYATMFNRQYYEDEDDYKLVLEQLLPDTLSGLTALSALSLSGHDMPVCPATGAYLPALRELALGLNEGLRELPHGPWPALERLEVDQELIDAALADQPKHRTGSSAGLVVGGTFVPAVEADGHALWSMRRLNSLEVFWMDREEDGQEDTARKQAIRRLLPQLHSL